MPQSSIGRSAALEPRAAAGSPLLRIWVWPLLLGLLSASGLITALVSEGWGDWWSWFALGLPVLVMAWFGWRRPSC